MASYNDSCWSTDTVMSLSFKMSALDEKWLRIISSSPGFIINWNSLRTRLCLLATISLTRIIANLRMRSYESSDCFLGCFGNSMLPDLSVSITFCFWGFDNPLSIDSFCSATGFESNFSNLSGAFSEVATKNTLPYRLNSSLPTLPTRLRKSIGRISRCPFR